MIKYQDVVQDRNGNAVVGAVVKVYATGTSNLSTISATDGGASINQTTSPLTTDANGEFEFFIDAGTYDLGVTRGGYDTVTQTGILIGGGTAAGPTWEEYAPNSYYTSDEVNVDVIYVDIDLAVNGSTVLGDTFVNKGLQETRKEIPEFDVSVSIGSLFTKVLSAPAVLTFGSVLTGTIAVTSFTLEITNSGGARTITWPASVVWPSPGTVPTPTTGVDVYTFYTRDDGVTWRGALVASYLS